MNAGDKPSEVNGVPISPSDYVIDFLRCTIEAEDPYMVAVFFHVLKLAEIAPCLRTCRVKNKFLDERLPTHIQTNVLMNLLLLYPSTAEEFAESGMFGEFDESMAGKCLMVCELQITMKDFLQIKRLQHCYYDLTRVKRDDLAAFLLSSGPFIDPNTLEEKVPSVVKQMEEQSSRLSVAMPGGGGGGGGGASGVSMGGAAVLKSGMLQKAGRSTFGKSFKKRYFVLSLEGSSTSGIKEYSLQYFTSEDRKDKKGEFGLAHGFVYAASDSASSKDFVVVTRSVRFSDGGSRGPKAAAAASSPPSRRHATLFPLRAASIAEAEAWMDAIQRAIDASS